jgi:phosphate starvation-inducible protein PhoH and related proteins
LDNVDPIVVLGPHDVNLHQIESAYPGATITARGERISVSGSIQDFQEIRSIFQDLSGIARRTSQITERDVRTVLTIRQRARAARVPHDTDDMLVARTGAPSSGASIPPITTPEESGVIVYTHGGGAVRAKTAGQQRIVDSHAHNDIVFAIGPAGTGKTYTAVALAVKALKERRVKRIVLCRPAVEAGESLGFLPGDLKDKIDPYLRPLYDSLEEMIDHDRLELNITKNIIEIVPLAYMRGRTLNNAFVILDEAQNATTIQMKMFLTRLGLNSRAIITGDVTQTDLPKKASSGLIEIPRILGNIKGIDFIYLDQSDVVRHKLIRDIIEAYEKYENRK